MTTATILVGEENEQNSIISPGKYFIIFNYQNQRQNKSRGGKY